MDPHEKIFELLYVKDEVTWQNLLYELVKTEQMDPWDINISMLTKKYIDTIKKLKELDFRVSGKVLLAAAILLKIKSNRLLNEDLSEFDRLLADPSELMEGMDIKESYQPQGNLDRPLLIPRMPQPRKRKVSIFDLVDALEKALEVKKRRVMNSIPPMHMEAPKKARDITQVLKDVYGKIISFFSSNKEKLMFSQLTPSQSKEDRIYTFIPLLHLANQQKIDLSQKEHFGEIEVMLASRNESKSN